MGLLDPTQAGNAGRVFDASHASVRISGARAPKGSVKSATYGEKVEGVEHVYELGSKLPFAMTSGVIKPEEFKLTVYMSKAQEILQIMSPTGNYYDPSVDIDITYDEQSVPGLAALSTALKLPTVSVVAEGCRYIGQSTNVETGGGAVMAELTFLPLRVKIGNLPGTSTIL